MTDQDNQPDPTHQHNFVIPVEWEQERAKLTDGFQGRVYLDKEKVTKLRCQCGEEVERG